MSQAEMNVHLTEPSVSQPEAVDAGSGSFTPGPWVYMEKPAASFHDHGWRAMAMCGTKWMVAAPSHVALKQWNNEANACLIACAPELVTTLAEATGMLSACMELLAGRARASQSAADEIREQHAKCLDLLKRAAPKKLSAKSREAA